MLIVCRAVDKANEKFVNELGEVEELYDIALIGFGSAADAMTSGTNMDGTSCFENGRFNGKKMAHCSSYINATTGSSIPMEYWNFETQSWGG